MVTGIPSQVQDLSGYPFTMGEGERGCPGYAYTFPELYKNISGNRRLSRHGRACRDGTCAGGDALPFAGTYIVLGVHLIIIERNQQKFPVFPDFEEKRPGSGT